MTIQNLCMQEMMKTHVEIMHMRQWQTNNLTLYSSEFRVHATTKSMQTRDNCMNMHNPTK